MSISGNYQERLLERANWGAEMFMNMSFEGFFQAFIFLLHQLSPLHLYFNFSRCLYRLRMCPISNPLHLPKRFLLLSLPNLNWSGQFKTHCIYDFCLCLYRIWINVSSLQPIAFTYTILASLYRICMCPTQNPLHLPSRFLLLSSPNLNVSNF